MNTPIVVDIEKVHEAVFFRLRAAKTSELVIMIALQQTDDYLSDVIAAIPDHLKDREVRWLIRAIADEIDRRIPIPA